MKTNDLLMLQKMFWNKNVFCSVMPIHIDDRVRFKANVGYCATERFSSNMILLSEEVRDTLSEAMSAAIDAAVECVKKNHT